MAAGWDGQGGTGPQCSGMGTGGGEGGTEWGRRLGWKLGGMGVTRFCIWAGWIGPNWAEFGMSSVLRLTEPRNQNRTEYFGS